MARRLIYDNYKNSVYKMAAETFKRVASPRAQEFIKDRAALKMMHHRMGELVGHDEIQETKITAERRSPKSSYNPPLEHDEEMARMSRNRRAGEADGRGLGLRRRQPEDR